MNVGRNLKYSLEYYKFNVQCGYNYILFILSVVMFTHSVHTDVNANEVVKYI